MKALGIAVIVVIATALFGALAFTLYNGGKAGNELVLKTIVEPGERIVPGMAVVVDSMAAGSVRDVANEYGTIVATLAIENPVCQEVLRIGTVRKSSDEYVLLATQEAQPGAPKLKSGDIVRVSGSAIGFVLPKFDDGTRKVVVVGVTAMIVIFIIWKIFRSLLGVGMALLLSLIVAWIAYPLAVPFVDQHLQPVLASIQSAPAETNPDGFAGIQAQLFNVLSSRPNSSIVAFLLLTLGCLPFSAVLIYKVGSLTRRGISSAVAVGSLLAALSVPVSASAADVSYSLNSLRQEQLDARKTIDHSANLCDVAERLLGANLVREASEKVTEALFTLDTMDIRLSGYDDRVQALKASVLSYLRSDEQKKLRGGMKMLNERMREVRDSASDNQKRASELNTKEANMIQVYLVLADSYRRRIREGLNDWVVVQNETRQLSGFPLPLIRSGVVNIDNVTRCRIGEDDSVILPNGVAVMPDGSLKRTETQVKLTELEAEAQKLRRELDDVRKQQTQTVSSVVAPVSVARDSVPKPKKTVTNLAVKKIAPNTPVAAKTVPHADSQTNPPLAFASVPVAIIVTTPAQVEPEKKVETPIRATTPVLAVAPPVVKEASNEPVKVETNQAVAVAETPLSLATPQVERVVATKPQVYATAIPRAMIPKTSGIDKKMIPIAIASGVFALAIIGIALGINHKGQSHEVTIAAQPKGGPFAEHKLVSSRGEQIVLGDGEPRIEPTGLNLPAPATISISARGKAEIQPGTATVLVNGEVITRKTTVNPGSSIQIKRDDQNEPDAETYTLRFVDPVASVKLQDVEEGELVTITQEK